MSIKNMGFTSFFQPVCTVWGKVSTLLSAASPLVDLAARLYVAKVFFMSGLVKIRDWDSTLFLFQEEYHVPLLPPDFAAYLATTGELVLPILLVLGLTTRFAATGLFILNLVAVLSYYTALKDSPAALQDHLEWGLILGLLMTQKIRALTADYWLKNWLKS
ncbi:DoxX family protein [Hydromonas duriensis]|uniref:Putative oxidoreductase n=1 Tax=Hydromonas duriensis TaxID=1527608 RepID=A0A4R6Y8T0_9BURK|nr:DoxX family protein [Hydromonas duriensis]TDR31801.1 putative oxidoreductase [Hydromonas duriensis]